MNIAIIGSGVSGLSCAYHLMKKYPNWNITLIESESKLGGHANTIKVNIDGVENKTDIGFMVFNRKTYPNFIEFTDKINADLFKSNMSFSATNNNKTWSSNKPFHLKNIVHNSKIFLEILKWNKCANRPSLENETLGSFIERNRFSKDFLENYLLPMSCAIWSCDSNTILNFSASSFLSFINNHGLSTLTNHPEWLSFIGGSKNYVNYIENLLITNGNQILLNTPVRTVKKDKDVYIINDDIKFNKLIFATHTDISSELIKELNDPRAEYLKKIKYSPSKISVHSDESFMPIDKKLWCSWNTMSFEKNLICTYWINNLQYVKSNKNIFVSLNCDVKNSYFETNLSHPLLNSDALDARKKINELTLLNHNDVYFIGAWQGYGFHEDGWTSGKVLVNEIL